MASYQEKNEMNEFLCRCTFHKADLDDCRVCNPPRDVMSTIIEHMENLMKPMIIMSIATSIMSSFVRKKGKKK